MKDVATKAMYAAVGAPLVAKRRLAELGERVVEGARSEYESWSKAGEKAGNRIRKSDMVEELSSRLDLDQIQGRVDRLRDQLDDALTNWRESFRPETGTPATKPDSAAKVTKPAARKPAARKPAAKKPAAKATTAKKPAPKKTTAKKPAAKKTTK